MRIRTRADDNIVFMGNSMKLYELLKKTVGIKRGAMSLEVRKPTRNHVSSFIFEKIRQYQDILYDLKKQSDMKE